MPTGTTPSGTPSSSRRRNGLTCDMISLPSAHLADIGALLDFVDAFCRKPVSGRRISLTCAWRSKRCAQTS